MKFIFKIDKADNKNPDMKEKETKVLKLYEQIEDMLEGFEEYAEEVREEITTAKADNDKLMTSMDKASLDEEKIDEWIGEILDRKLDNKVSEAVRRIVARSIKDEMESVIDEISSRIERLEKSEKVITLTSSGESNAAITEFMPDEFVKTPDTLEELGASIEKAMKNNSSNETKEEKKRKRKKVIELYNSGMSINDIAKELGIASSEIKLIIEFLN